MVMMLARAFGVSVLRSFTAFMAFTSMKSSA